MKWLFRAWLVVPGCLMLLALLAGCAPGTSSTASSPGSPTQTATAASGATGQNGCTSQNPPATAGTKADVVVTFAGGADGQKVALNKGQTLEVRLPASMRWSLSVQGDASVLSAATDNGWYDASGDACVWRFAAAKQGTATLAFAGVAVCKPHTQCPTLATSQEYDITVH